MNNLVDDKNALKNIIQMENYLFDGDGFELKLTHQYGNDDSYNFEVESTAKNIDVEKICTELGLVPDLSPKDETYWNEFNKKINLDLRKMSRSELEGILKGHMKNR